MTGGRGSGAPRAVDPPPAWPAARVVHYVDPVDDFQGHLAFCGDDHRLAAGGLRVQPGLRCHHVARLAEAMLLKERLLGLAVDGAKAGIDYDPASPGKRAALGRFLRFLRPHLDRRLSLGSDLNTRWAEIEEIARGEGIPSVKAAVARAQGLGPEDFRRRLGVLDERVDGRTVGQRRAGHALAHAALAACEELGIAPDGACVGIQGFGTLGRAAAQSLGQQGFRVAALSDVGGCLLAGDGLDVPALLGIPPDEPIVRDPPPGAVVTGREAMFEQPLDVLLLAACEDALSLRTAAALAVRAVVVGANLGLSGACEDVLHRRGVLVVPDFVAGCGGSASMDALFGAPACPGGREVLDRTGARMRELVGGVLGEARRRDEAPRAAALRLCGTRPLRPGDPPYGRWTPSALAPVSAGRA